MAGLSGFVIASLMLVVIGAGVAGFEMVRASEMFLVPAIGFWFIALLALVGVGIIAAILATKDVRVVTMMQAYIPQPPATPPQAPVRRQPPVPQPRPDLDIEEIG